MMLCDKVKSLLSAFLENDLSHEESEQISQHLSNCNDCREVFNDAQIIRNRLLQLPSVTPSADFDRLLRQRIQNSPNDSGLKFSTRSITYSLSGIGLIAASYFIIGTLFLTPKAKPGYAPVHQTPVMSKQVNTSPTAQPDLPGTYVAEDTVKSKKANIDQSRINLVNENK